VKDKSFDSIRKQGNLASNFIKGFLKDPPHSQRTYLKEPQNLNSFRKISQVVGIICGMNACRCRGAWVGYASHWVVPGWLRNHMMASLAVLALTSARADSLDAWSLFKFDTNTALTCITFGDNGFVVAGEDSIDGFILHSNDGASWSRMASPISNVWWQAATYGGGRYVLVGSTYDVLGGQSTILLSTDGRVWSEVRRSAEDNLRAVSVGRGLLVAGGSGPAGSALVLTSPDGVSWARHLLGLSGDYDEVATLGYGGSGFLAATAAGALWRSTDGTNWTQLRAPLNGALNGITVGPGLEVVVGGWNGGMFNSGGQLILTSTDGTHWQTAAQPARLPLVAVAYGNGFYATVDGGGGIFSSEDGICWTPRPNLATAGLKGIAFGNNRFVAVGNEGTMLRSGLVDTNAVRVKFVACGLYAVREQDGYILVPVRRVGGTNDAVSVRYTTADGTALAGQDYEATAGVLTFGSGEVERSIPLHVLNDELPEGTETFTLQLEKPISGAELGKPDSATIQILDSDSAHLDQWVQSVPQSFASDLRGVAYDGGAFVTVGTKANADPSVLGWEVLVLRSSDGQQWQDASPGIAGVPRALCWGGGQFVAVGQRYDPELGTWWQQILSSPDGVTWQETLVTLNDDLAGVCYGNGRFVAVGAEYRAGQWVGKVVTSIDGLNWLRAGIPPDLAPLRSVVWGNGVFFAVGGAWRGPSGAWTNLCLSSTDGKNWTPRPTTLSLSEPSIAYGNGLFVLAATDACFCNKPILGVIATSPDGITWTQRFSATNLSLGIAAYLNGSFLVLGGDSSGAVSKTVLLSSSDGSTWNTINSFPGGLLGGLAYGGGLYAWTGAGIWTSPDTTTWQERLPGKVELTDITYGGGLFAAVGSTILTSPDGNHWNTQSGTLPYTLQGVAYGSGRFVAVAAEDAVMVSDDGIDWTNRRLGANAHLSRAAYGNGRFVAIGGPPDSNAWPWTNRVFVSTNGLDWTQTHADSTSSAKWVDLTFGKDLFVAVGGDAIYTSPDGLTWTSRPTDNPEEINAVTFGNGIFVTVGGRVHPGRYTYTTSLILTSLDGQTWTSRPLPAGWSPQAPYFYGWPLTGVVYGGGTFVAVGTGDQGYYGADVIVTSPDGVNWTARTSDGGAGLNRIASGNGRLAAVGQGGRVVRPAVVLSLTSLPSATNAALILSVGSEIGVHHELQASTNLLDWKVLTKFTNTHLRTEARDPQAGLYQRRFYRVKEASQ